MTWTLAAASVVTLSVVSFAAYGLDKRAAKAGRRRTPEKTLHTLDILGGWPGGWLAQRTFRHKTRKMSFQLVYWATVAAHVAVMFTLLRTG